MKNAMPKKERVVPDVTLKLPISEFLAPCSVYKGVVTVSFEKMTAVLQRAKARQVGEAAPQQKAELDKLRAQVAQLQKDAKSRRHEADPDEAEGSGASKKERKKAKKEKEVGE